MIYLYVHCSGSFCTQFCFYECTNIWGKLKLQQLNLKRQKRFKDQELKNSESRSDNDSHKLNPKKATHCYFSIMSRKVETSASEKEEEEEVGSLVTGLCSILYDSFAK